MGKVYIFSRLTDKVRSIAALLLIMAVAVGSVFAQYDGTGTFTKITSVDELTTGYYVVANQGGEFAMTSEVNAGSTKYLLKTDAEFENPQAAIVWLIDVAADGTVTLYNEAEGAYAAYSGSGNSAYTITSLSDKGKWNVSLDAAGNFVFENVATAGRYLSYNAGSPRFACYANNGQEEIALYKRDGAAPVALVKAPVFSIPSGTYYTAPQTIALSCETEGANIYYSINGGEEVLYSAPFTINSNSTVVAYAKLGENNSVQITETFTFVIPTEVASIAAFKAAEGDANTVYKITGDVTYNYGANGNRYVQDPTGGLLVYDYSVITNNYNPGDVISGGLVGKKQLYNGLVEMIPVENPAEGVAGTENLPVAVTMADIAADPDAYMSRLVTITNCAVAADITFNTTSTQNLNMTQGSNTMQIRNVFRTLDKSLAAGQFINVTGFVGRYNSTLQIFPRYNEDIEVVNTTLPLVCDFDNNSNSATLVNGTAANKWYVGQAQGFDNNKLYISSSNGLTNKYNTNEAAVSHAWMPVTMPASDVILSFDYRSNGENEKDFLQISIVDASAEVVAGTLPTDYLARLNGQSEVKHYQVVIPASFAGAKKLVFTWTNDAANGEQTPACIDNIEMKTTCTAPTNLAAAVEGQTAVITWTAPEGQNSWTVEYKDSESHGWISQNVTNPTITLDNLSTEVTYDVRVKANCGEESSVWTKANFNVPCINLTTSDLNFTIGTGTSTSYHPFYAYYGNSWAQVIYPKSNFETPGYINSISWEVNSAAEHEYTSLKIYMGTTSLNANTTSSWLPMDELTLVYEKSNGKIGSAAGWETYNLSTPYYYNGEDNLVIVVSRAASGWKSLYYKGTTGQTNAVLYRYADGNSSYAEHPGTATGYTASTLPNMKVDYTGYVCGDEKCAAPADLAVSNITTDGAKLTWTGDAPSYMVSYKAQDEAEFTTVEVANTQFTLTGLADNTDYVVAVVAKCGNVGDSKEVTAAFKTEAICKVPANLQVSHNIANTEITWSPIAGVNQYEIQYGIAGGDIMHSAFVNDATVYTIAALDENTQYTVRVRTICGEDSHSDWAELTFTRPLICSTPTELTVTDVTVNSASLTWNAGDASSWTVRYNQVGSDLSTTITTNTNSVTITGLSSNTKYEVSVKGNCAGYLSPWSTAVTLNTECGPYTVTNSNPWFEDFEGYTGSGEKAFDPCWETPVKSTSNAPFVYCNYSGATHSGVNSMELKGTTNQENVVVLPVFSNDIATLQLSFFANTTASSVANAGTFEVGYVTDANDGSTFVALNTVTPFSTSLNRANSDFYGPFNYSSVAAENARMAIHFKSSYGSYSATSWNLDDITVSLIPNCQAPMNLVATEVTVNSATVAWTTLGEEESWNVQYGPAGFALGEGTIVETSTKPYQITGLTTGTSYDVYVNAICGVGNESEWVGPITVTPAAKCTYRLELTDSYGDGWNNGKITVTQNGSSQTYTISSGSSATYNVEVLNGTDVTFTYNTGSYAGENSFVIYDYDNNVVWQLTSGDGNNGANITVVPSCYEVEPSGCESTCQFTILLTDEYGDGWTGWDDDYNTVVDGLLTIKQNGEVVGEYALEDGYSANYNVELCDNVETEFILDPGYFYDEIGVTITNTNGDVIWSVSDLDEGDEQTYTFTVDCGDAPASCVKPTDLAVESTTENSAVLAWTGDAAVTYQVEYRKAEVEAWSTATVTGLTYTINNLETNATYYARVKAVCDVENTYTDEVFFFISTSSACNDTEVGDQSSTTYYIPVNTYYKNSYSQQIFTPEEIGGSGNITKIAFNYQYSSSINSKGDVTIYIANTDKTEFSSNTDWQTEGLTQVYHGNMNCVQGWNEFVLDEPFAYDNSSNLIVAVLDNSGSYNSSSYKFYCKTGSNNTTLYYYNDYSQWSASSSGTRTNIRNDIRFTVCASEFSDVQVEDISFISQACEIVNEHLSAHFKNVGSTDINKVEAYYSINGGVAVHETINLPEALAQGESTYFSFNTPITLTEPNNTIKVWITVPGDGSFNNNVAYTTSSIVAPLEVPYFEDFSGDASTEWAVGGNGIANASINDAIEISGNDYEESTASAYAPCIYLPAGRYQVAYDYYAKNAAYVENFKVLYGMSLQTLEGVVAEHTFSNTEPVRAYNTIEITEGGVYYFIIKGENAPGNMGFFVDNFSIKRLIRTNVYYAAHGDGTPEGQLEVPEGEELTIEIVPEVGYHVFGIYKNQVLVRGENTDNAAVEYFTFVPNNYDNIYVDFTTNKYEINAIVENYFVTEYNDNALGATYTPSHEVLYHGATHTGIIALAPNYHIEGVYVNGLNMTSDLVAMEGNQYKFVLSPIAEDKDIRVVAGLDSARIVYTVLAGEGVINNTFVVDGETELPATYVETIQGYIDFLSSITPAPGYHVESIIIDGVEHNIIELYSFEKLLGTHNVVIVFAKNHYVITTNGYGNGTVSNGVEFDYDPDFVYVFKATPAADNHIVSVLRNNVELTVADPQAMFTDTLRNILDNYDYQVLFAPDKYNVTASAGEGGSISNAGTITYNYDEDVDYVINANEGYYIASVTVDGVETVYTQDDALTTTTVHFDANSGNHTVNATFAPFIYTITVNAGQNGAITPGTSTYEFNTTPTFLITPNTGYGIVDVTVDGESKGAISTYTFPALTSDHTIAATFAAYQYTITANAGNGGTITPAGVTNMVYGGNQTYTITASNGYHIANVYVDGVAVADPTSTYTFENVTANHTIYAVFEANQYTITVNQPANGTITPSGVITVQYGETPTFVITPNTGYSVSQITVNASTQVINNATHVNDIYTYTFPAVSSNQTITATMTAKTYTITASAGSNGTITPNGNVNAVYGSTHSFQITPNDGYVVDNVTVDGMSMGSLGAYTFTNVVANHTINVTFKMAECVAPTNLQTTYIDSTSAVLNWYHPGAASFDIQYKTIDGTFSSISAVTGNSYTLMGLNPGTTYLWQIRANCAANNHSDWTNMVVFKTNNPSIEVGLNEFDPAQIKVYAERQNIHIMNTSNVATDGVRVYDIYGKLLYQGSLNSDHEVINMNVAAGTYIVNVATEYGFYNYKVTIVR